MITSLKPLFEAAEKENFAYGAFNVNSIAQIEGALRIHEIFESPMVLQGAELANGFMSGNTNFKESTLDEKLRGMEVLANAFHKIVGPSFVPGVLHLDHGTSFEVCKGAVDSGYTSIMIDGSSKPLEENIELTKKVVDYAHKYGVSVEGELGVLKGVEDDIVAHHSTYTNPLDAIKFIKETKVDGLAISYGTSHGANKGKNVKLRKEIPIAIREAMLHEDLNCSLVSHGSSNVEKWLVEDVVSLGGKLENTGGIPVSELQEVINSGIRKINVDTDIRLMTTRNIRQLLQKEKGDKYGEMVRNRLNEKPENFDPRYYLQDLMDAVTKNEMSSDFVETIFDTVKDSIMEVCGRLIIAFDSYEKIRYVNSRTLNELKEEYK